MNHDGLALYAELIGLFDRLPRMDRPAALRLAELASAKRAKCGLALTLDLIDLFLSRDCPRGPDGRTQSARRTR